MARLEKLDFALTNLVFEKVMGKRVRKSYYSTLGKVSAYQTIVNSLPKERILDYLVMGLAKTRTQEIISMVAHQDKHSSVIKSISQAQLLTSLQKMTTVSTLDKAFNLDAVGRSMDRASLRS